MLGKMSLLDLLSFKNSEEVIKYTSEYKPAYFNWYIFNAGEIMHLAAIMLFYYKNRFKL
jgi:hypothetical protein